MTGANGEPLDSLGLLLGVGGGALLDLGLAGDGVHEVADTGLQVGDGHSSLDLSGEGHHISRDNVLHHGPGVIHPADGLEHADLMPNFIIRLMEEGHLLAIIPILLSPPDTFKYIRH